MLLDISSCFVGRSSMSVIAGCLEVLVIFKLVACCPCDEVEIPVPFVMSAPERLNCT